MMIKIKANIKLFCGKGKRKTAFTSGYRPLFDVVKGTKQSGMITLLDRNEFKPCDEGIVEIKFLEADCIIGTQFSFCESEEILGEGEVIEIIK